MPAPNLYTLEIPLRLAVEANSRNEAHAKLRQLYEEAMLSLPTGAGCFMKDAEWSERAKSVARA